MSDLQTKLGGGLNKLQDSLQQGKQKLQTAQEISQYKKEIQELLESRCDLILKLGEDTYRKIRANEIQDQQLREYLLDIAQLDVKVFKAEKALDLLIQKNASSTCSSCGTTLNGDDKFCGSCGQKQEERTALTNLAQMVICPTCEEQTPTDATFCSCCGSRLVL